MAASSRPPRRLIGVVALALLPPGVAGAHSFGQLYNLPVPFWLYVYGAAAVLVLSFLLLGYFVGQAPHAGAGAGWRRDMTGTAWVLWARRLRLVPALRALAVLLLGLCIATGFWGNRDPYRNFNMTFFWIVFGLGFAYLTAFVGDLYAAVNPWRALVRAVGTLGWKGFGRGRVAYPAWLGYWPALGLYAAFVWIELFYFNRPRSLAVMLSVYTLLNLAGAWLVGERAWFRHGEFFAVFLRLVALMAPVDYAPRERDEAGREVPGHLRLRTPFSGLLETRATSIGLLVFVLFMLSSTAFDGLHATAAWFRFFWTDPYGVLETWFGQKPVRVYPRVLPLYTAWESVVLLGSPFVYLGVYWLFVALAKRVAGSPLPVRDLALRFAFSLLPIALVYNVTHYYTLVLSQGVKIVSLASDPFGKGWNLFGTEGLFRAPILPDVGATWHTQVGLIVLGHVVSVWAAHVEALRIFPTRRAAIASQVPMLALMVVFTTVGLWILAQPITEIR